MHPFFLFLLAILSPILLATTLLVLPYAGIAGATYIIYDKGQAVHPLQDKLDDVFYILNVYGTLLQDWSNHVTDANPLTYTLPLIVIPLAAISLALWMTVRVARKLKDIFQSSVSI